MKKSPLVSSLFVFTLCALFSGGLLLFLIHKQDERIRAHVKSRSLEIKQNIEQELTKSETVLWGIEGLFQSSEYVTSEEFSIFCSTSINEQIPLHLIEWQPKIPREKREEFEKNLLKRGVKGFPLFEISETGEAVAAKDRPFHFPVQYSFSSEPDYQAIGLDLAFSPERMNSKYRSMKVGKPVMSGVFDVVIKNSSLRKPGFALSHAIFNDPSISASDSFKHLKGFVAIVLYLDDFFAPISRPEKIEEFQFLLRDLSGGNQVIYSTVKADSSKLEYRHRSLIKIGYRDWELEVFPTKDFLEGENTYFPYFICFLLLLLGVAFSLYLFFKKVNKEKMATYERHIQQKQRLESLGVLASGIAHEFNNILQCISLANENIKSSQLEKTREENIDTSLEYCKRGQSLVRQILSFARQDAGELKEVLPSKEIKNTLELIRSSHGKNIVIEESIQEKGDSTLLMNTNHISQILINLCNNAAHAMNQKGTIKISYTISENGRILKVKDNGSGMDEEVSQKAFDPFFSTKPVNEGTGLGLSVIYGIVKSYNGEIKVNSQLGVGSEFIIKLPLD